MLVKPKRDLKTVLKAIRKHKGLMYRAAQALDVTPRTLYNYSKKHPEAIKQAIDDSRGEFLDCTELGLMGAVDRDEAWAIMFTLRTLGRNRGYIENQSTTVNAEIIVNPYGTVNTRFTAQLGNGEGDGNLEPNDRNVDEG
jgi:hypothetical protein